MLYYDLPVLFSFFIFGVLFSGVIFLFELKRVNYKASYDGLTNLYRRERFLELLDNEISRSKRYGRKGCVMLIDIDNFKMKNDKFGHKHGDFVLRHVGRILKSCSRTYDIVGRYGGEEFTIFLPEVDREGAFGFSKRLAEETKKATSDFVSGPVTYSIGVACFPAHGDTKEKLIQNADSAMYEAKKTKNDVRVCNVC